jgi:hypothetical protein
MTDDIIELTMPRERAAAVAQIRRLTDIGALVGLTMRIAGKTTTDGRQVRDLIDGWLEGTGATWRETDDGFDIDLPVGDAAGGGAERA